MRGLVCLATTVAIAIGVTPAFGQSATASLSGTVVDDTGATVPDVTVTTVNEATALTRQAITGRDGGFAVPLLPPGRYMLRAERDGFTPLEMKDLVLNVGDQLTVTLRLKVAGIGESVSVLAEATRLSTSPAVATVVDREFVENLPLSGRSFHSLMALTPGLVFTKSGTGELGQFSVNGQRSNTNYFMVDGVSANVGVRASSLIQTAAGSLPALTAAGGTNNLVSVDALEEFKIQTSSYAPEFGRSPGAQISLLTRSGTNAFHGAIADYFRNDALDAIDWFVKRDNLPKPALRQQQFAAVVGGPLRKGHTFFFFSYEGLRLRVPQAKVTDVPSLRARQNAIPAMQPFLNAFPLPNGPEGPNGLAPFTSSFSDPSSLDATSVRIDHTVGPKVTVFGRYNHAPSNLSPRTGPGFYSINTIAPTDNKTQTLTSGATWVLAPAIVNDLRANWSRSLGAQADWHIDEFGGATVLPDTLAFPPGVSRDDGLFVFQIAGATNGSYATGKNVSNLQRQLNVVDTLSVVARQHQLKFGLDYRWLTPLLGISRYSLSTAFLSVADAMVGRAFFTGVSAKEPGSLGIHNLSLFAQDTWKAASRLTLTYGLRWDLNPPPAGRKGKQLLTVQGVDNPATMTLAPLGTPLYQTIYTNVAPRAGVAYQVTDRPGRETVVRGGAGVFYDLGTGAIGSALSAFPFSANKLFGPPVTFPLDPALAGPPPIALTRPYGYFIVPDPHLTMPRTYQWNASVEQSLGRSQTVSVSYVGAAGRQLLRPENFFQGLSLNPDFSQGITLLTNQAFSDYRALQVQFDRRLSHGLQVLASYTWSSSTDTISGDAGGYSNISARLLDPRRDLGPSDFDVRHSASAAVTYYAPAAVRDGMAHAVLRDWSVDAIVRTRSGTPLDVFVSRNIGFGSFPFRPDVVPGVPFYVDDPTAPGGRRINRAAFVVPTELRQGTLGRNSLRGFTMSQVDFALRRTFPLYPGVRLQFIGELFNLFNTPNFGDPSGFLTSATFGRSTQMLGRSLGIGGVNGGFSPLYQIGGPRSVQLSLRLSF